jgi:hypothetical protein
MNGFFVRSAATLTGPWSVCLPQFHRPPLLRRRRGATPTTFRLGLSPRSVALVHLQGAHCFPTESLQGLPTINSWSTAPRTVVSRQRGASPRCGACVTEQTRNREEPLSPVEANMRWSWRAPSASASSVASVTPPPKAMSSHAPRRRARRGLVLGDEQVDRPGDLGAGERVDVVAVELADRLRLRRRDLGVEVPLQGGGQRVLDANLPVRRREVTIRDLASVSG